MNDTGNDSLGPATTEPRPRTALMVLIAECESRLGRDPVLLDWHTGLNLSAEIAGVTVFSPPAETPSLPYLDHTIDIVAVPDEEPAMLGEARRVASTAVVVFRSAERSSLASGCHHGPFPELSVEWQSGRTATRLPSASVIIPSYNGSALLESCLAGLRETLPVGSDAEILVVDDASTDQTPALFRRWAELDKRVRGARHSVNAGFIAACNSGAAAATGEILVFLNNDTIPLSGWLAPLLRMFRDIDDAGAIGGKLVYSDGRLQEAGGVIFSDGTGANFGRGDHNLDDPLYNYVRDVDYCSGALLATPRHLFEELGGFDSYYAPAYYEDTDYCFRVRAKGYRVYYQPESTVIHLEGASCGTNLSEGIKRYQVINRGKFVARWAEVLKCQPPPAESYSMSTWHRLAVRAGGERI